MKKFFSKNKSIFYLINLLIIIFYIFPGSILGLAIYNDINIQPQITPNFIISSNHFYLFVVLSIIGLLTFMTTKQRKYLIIYLIVLSFILELFHFVIPSRSFQWSDLFGNLSGVAVVILIYNLINKYGGFKK